MINQNFIYLFPIFFVLGFITILISAIISSKKNKGEPSYKETFKEKIIRPLIENEIEGAKYYPKGGIGREQYDKAGYKEHYDRYNSDDLVISSLKIDDKTNSEFAFSEVHTEYESTDSDGNTTYTTVFHGLAGSFKITKPINSSLYIRSNGRVSSWNKEKINMDMPEFEKVFDVESNDKILTMRILTPDIMAEILDLYRKYKYRFEISIIKDKVYMRLMTGAMFEPNFFGKAMNYKTVEKYYLVLKALIDIATHIFEVVDNLED